MGARIGWGTKTRSEEKFWDDWRNGKKIIIYVNPENPTESVIFNKIDKKHRSQNLALILGGGNWLNMALSLDLATRIRWNRPPVVSTGRLKCAKTSLLKLSIVTAPPCRTTKPSKPNSNANSEPSKTPTTRTTKPAAPPPSPASPPG